MGPAVCWQWIPRCLCRSRGVYLHDISSLSLSLSLSLSSSLSSSWLSYLVALAVCQVEAVVGRWHWYLVQEGALAGTAGKQKGNCFILSVAWITTFQFRSRENKSFIGSFSLYPTTAVLRLNPGYWNQKLKRGFPDFLWTLHVSCLMLRRFTF